ncbi:MAG: hypothetical protein LUE24_11800 [Lachnospiraceae bacterium]|nr:hypothetical protein [Lachnospiraceae bacterium]
MENNIKQTEFNTGQERAGSVCPLMVMADRGSGDTGCCREQCGWWVYERACCAIQMLAREAALTRLGGQRG